MSKLILSEKQFMLRCSKEVTDICQPFFKNFKIKHFNYFRYYHDGSVYGLITTPELLKYHIKKEYVFSPYLSNISSKKFSYIAMPNLNDKFSQASYDYQNLFHIYYPLYLYEMSEDYFDLFTYSCAGPPSEVINYYLTHMDILEKFKHFFKDKASLLLKEAEKNKILLPPKMHTNFKKLTPLKTTLIDHTFMQEFNSSKYKREHDNEIISLTKREIDCVKCMIQGMTAKQTAKSLSISPRTVEYYRENLKIKTNASNKFEIIDKLKNILNF